MCRWLAGFGFVLLMAASAAGQGQQRVYVFPQTTTVSPGQPGLINAMCLDPTVIGAPGTNDPITRWQRPDVMVIRRLRNGQVVGTQRGSDLVRGVTPWVRFEGASDITGRVALRAVAARPETGVSYEVEFIDGTAASRPQEALTGDVLARLSEFDQSFGVINAELCELRAAFPADALLTRLYATFAQRALYPAMSRDVPANELARDTRRFIGRLESACQTTNGEAQALLATFLAGAAEPTSVQRAVLERHGMASDKVELADDELAAVEQVRKAYAETMFQGCAGLCGGDANAAADGLVLARRAMERLAAWHQAGVRCDGPEIAYALGPAFDVTFRNGEPWLSRETGIAAFSLPQLAKRFDGIRDAMSNKTRRENLGKELARLQERLARLNVTSRLPGEFWDWDVPQQACALVLLGEQIRGVPLQPWLEKLLHAGPALALTLRVALQERRWLIEAGSLGVRERQMLERRAAELTELTGIACTLLTSESTRDELAGGTEATGVAAVIR